MHFNKFTEKLLAACLQGNLSQIQLLLNQGANPNALDDVSILEQVLLENNLKLDQKLQVAEILLQGGANPNIHQFSSAEIQDLLVKYGADPAKFLPDEPVVEPIEPVVKLNDEISVVEKAL